MGKTKFERKRWRKKYVYQPQLTEELSSKSPVKINSSPRILEGERILDDNYPVYAGYAYICNGMLIESDITGNVKQLKLNLEGGLAAALNISSPFEIRSCNLEARLEEYISNL